MCFVYSHVPCNQTESVRIENLPNIKLFARKFKKLNIRKMENLKTKKMKNFLHLPNSKNVQIIRLRMSEKTLVL